ncbi:MAG: hypothetical protein ACXWQE_00085 [Bdellovibrionales bacterium]
MSLRTRVRSIVAKIESVYGTDASPTGSANAILCKNLNFTPLATELVNRDLIRPYFGNSENLMALKYGTVDFEVEMVGRGQVGVAPSYDCLLRACAMTKSTTQVTCSIVVATLVATVTKTAHGYSIGDKILISGCTDTLLNGVQTIVTVPTSGTFTFATTASDASPAAGSPKLNTAIVYVPVTDSLESISIYYNVDGVLHKLFGGRGTFEISTVVKQIPTLKFTFTGLYDTPADVAVPTTDYTSFMIPQIVNTQNTPGFTLLSYSGNMESASMNVANDVQYITLVGSEKVNILDRKPAGTLVFEAPLTASKNFFSLASAQTQGALNLTHGSANGYKVLLDAASVLLGNPSYQDSNGVQMLSVPYTLNPVSGNDEFSLTFK